MEGEEEETEERDDTTTGRTHLHHPSQLRQSS